MPHDPESAQPGHRALAGQALRFGLVGVANTLISYATILFLTRKAGLAVGTASLVGYGAAMLFSFTLNRGWTFAATAPTRSVWRQAGGFLLVNGLCAALFSAVAAVTAPATGLALATVLGVLATLPLNFALNRWFVFRQGL